MKNILLTTLALIVGAFTTQSQTMYVDLNATGNNDGTSWANAYINLDTALALYDYSNFEKIHIAQGVYKPGDGTNRDSYFYLDNSHVIFGGYNAATGDRDIHLYKTILSGDLLGNDNGNYSESELTRQDNSYTVINSSVAISIDGLFIEGGHANYYSGTESQGRGGGVYMRSYGLDIRNCVFRKNFGSSGAAISWKGTTTSNAYIHINSNEFYDNVSKGNLINALRSNTYSHANELYIYNNLFHNNTITNAKGCLISAYSKAGSSAYFSTGSYKYEIYNNTFVDNVLPADGGAIMYVSVDDANVNFCHLDIKMLGNVFWNDNTQAIFFREDITNNEDVSWVHFYYNVIKGNDTITDLHNVNGGQNGNIYGLDPMFVDAPNRDYTISSCHSSVNDISSTQLASFTFPTVDFYKNPRIKGTRIDAGHCEVQQEVTDPFSVEQVGQTLVATAGFVSYTWANVTALALLNETSNILTPASDATYYSLAEDNDGCKIDTEADFCGSITISVAKVGDSLVTTATGGDTYQWYLNGNFISGAASANFTPTHYGTHKVYHWNNSGGCTGNATFVITCDDMTSAIVSQNGTTLELTNTYNSYQWLLNGTALSSATSATYSPTVDGDYQVVVAGIYACVDTSANFSYCSSVTVSITQNGADFEATTGYASYQWFLDGTEISGATSNTFTATQTGDYSCNATDASCTGSSNTLSYITVGIFETKERIDVTIYPNPTKSKVYINTDVQIIDVQIFNLNGQLVLENLKTNNINVSELNAGIYIVKVNTENGISIKKLIKK